MKVFIKEYSSFIFIYIFNLVFLFIVYRFIGGFNNKSGYWYFVFISLFLLTLFLTYEYFLNRRLYNKISEKEVNSLEHTISDLGNGPLAKAVQELLSNQYNIYIEQIHRFTVNQNQNLTFINQWVHQMKTPISVIQLIVQENEDDDQMKDIKNELEKLNRGLNMALYSARLNSFQYDFNVECINLKDITTEVINDLKQLFIKKRVFPEIKIDDKLSAHSDKKWLFFILQQVITNSIKYTIKENKKISVAALTTDEGIILKIEDEGVGISKADIKRVFQAFYTGENGRKFGESTGMGLYIVGEVCKRLGHKIYLESKVDKGTTITIYFRE